MSESPDDLQAVRGVRRRAAGAAAVAVEHLVVARRTGRDVELLRDRGAARGRVLVPARLSGDLRQADEGPADALRAVAEGQASRVGRSLEEEARLPVRDPVDVKHESVVADARDPRRGERGAHAVAVQAAFGAPRRSDVPARAVDAAVLHASTFAERLGARLALVRDAVVV